MKKFAMALVGLLFSTSLAWSANPNEKPGSRAYFLVPQTPIVQQVVVWKKFEGSGGWEYPEILAIPDTSTLSQIKREQLRPSEVIYAGWPEPYDLKDLPKDIKPFEQEIFNQLQEISGKKLKEMKLGDLGKHGRFKLIELTAGKKNRNGVRIYEFVEVGFSINSEGHLEADPLLYRSGVGLVPREVNHAIKLQFKEKPIDSAFTATGVRKISIEDWLGQNNKLVAVIKRKFYKWQRTACSALLATR